MTYEPPTITELGTVQSFTAHWEHEHSFLERQPPNPGRGYGHS